MSTKDPNTRDITSTMLAVVFVGILIAATFWILRPFLTSIVWAAIIVVATWPLLLKLQSVLWGKRGLAVTIMAVALLVVIVVPLMLVIMTIAGRSDDIAAKAKSLAVLTVPPPPEWVSSIPLAGRKLSERWQQYAALSPEELASQITPHVQTALRWFVSQAGSVATVLVQFLLTVIITAIMYLGGERGAAGVLSFARRLAGAQGEGIAVLAAKACRGVALGIVVTAIVQSSIGGIALAVAGVPAAPLLTAVMLLLCLAQLGPYLVLIPSVIWLYWSGHPLWGTILLLVSIFVGTINNILQPLLIKKEVDLPLLLILAGVIGGLIAFGIIGLFIGPVLLAVAHTLVQAWVHGAGTEEPSRTAGE